MDKKTEEWARAVGKSAAHEPLTDAEKKVLFDAKVEGLASLIRAAREKGRPSAFLKKQLTRREYLALAMGKCDAAAVARAILEGK